MSILQSLSRDHRKLEADLLELVQMPARESRARALAFAHFQALLLAHSRSEEVVVYGLLAERVPGDSAILDAREQHHVADLLLQELASSPPRGLRWNAKARMLGRVLHEHVKEEEVVLFPMISSHCNMLEQTALDEDFQALKHERAETLIGALRFAAPLVAGLASVPLQAAAGHWVRRGELYARQRMAEWALPPRQRRYEALPPPKHEGGTRHA